MIKLLDKQTIEKIAAGEVIERPSNVVKELIENSIDANSKNIIVEIENGGLSLIKICDDGDGFLEEDLPLAFKRYATSKISNIDDMYNLSTYGFRGEALSSIAIISDITIKSKHINRDFAYMINSKYGIDGQVEKCSKNVGTEIIIKNLFENLPVRKKAIDKIYKENSLIIDIIEKEAIINNNISFKLIVDGKLKIFTKGTSKMIDCIHDIYGRDIYNNVLNVDDIYNDIKIYGYIGKPSIMRSNRNDLVYYVNNRYIKSKIIEDAIDNAYKTFMMQHKYPLVILNINIDENDIDVNVHPRKTEVLFRNENDIYNAIYETIHKTLSEKELIHENFNNKYSYSTSIDINKIYNNHENESFIDFITKKNAIEENIVNNAKIEIENKNNRLIKKDITTDYNIIGQIFDTYILISYEDNIYVIDQHAAHEKINYEKLKKQFDNRINNKIEAENLLIPIVISLTKNQQNIIDKNKNFFEKFGFNIEHFGENDYKITSVPMILSNVNKKEMFVELLSEFENDYKNGENIENNYLFLEKIATMACKMSVKANSKLTLNDMKNLIDELFTIENPYNCPHGRPSIIKITKEDLDKKFKRII